MEKLTIEAKIDKLSEVLAFVDSRLENADCGMKSQMQIDIAVEEIFVNIASYAFEGKTGTVEIGFEVSGSRIACVRFTDSGVPYNPLEKPDPDTTLAADERQIGGLGIFMVKKSMDEMLYEHSGGKNILTLKKQI